MTRRLVPLPKPDPEAKFKPGDFEELLRNIPGRCVLIGGQAVAWWAEKYAIKWGQPIYYSFVFCSPWAAEKQVKELGSCLVIWTVVLGLSSRCRWVKIPKMTFR